MKAGLLAGAPAVAATPVSFVAATYTATGPTIAAANIPAHSAGDIGILFQWTGIAAAPALPAGWTDLGSDTVAPGARVSYKVLDGSETSVSFTAGTVYQAAVVVFSDAGSPLYGGTTNGASDGWDVPAGASIGSGGMDAAFIGKTVNSGLTIDPTGFTEQLDQGNSNGAAERIVIYTKTSAGGAYAGQTDVQAAGTWRAFTVSIPTA